MLVHVRPDLVHAQWDGVELVLSRDIDAEHVVDDRVPLMVREEAACDSVIVIEIDNGWDRNISETNHRLFGPFGHC